jgi:ABC-type sugar transport system permease subunit
MKIQRFLPNIFHFGICVAFLAFVFILVGLSVYSIFGGNSAIPFATSFKEVFNDRDFRQAITRTIVFTFTAISIKIVLAWPLAFLLHAQKKRSISVLLLIPWFIPTGISTLAWFWLFYDVGGGMNSLLTLFKLSPVAWLGRPDTAYLLCLFFNVWRELPLWALALMPSMAGYSGSISALALQDSLTGIQRFRLLILPRARVVLVVLTIMSFIWTSGEFDSIWILTRGGPGTSTELLALYAFRHSFMSQELGRGVVAYLLFLPIAAICLSCFMFIYRWSAVRSRI